MAAVRKAATAYRRGSHASNTTTDSQYGGMLKQWDLEDPARVRKFEEEDNKFAIVYPDQRAADYDAWYAVLFADGMNWQTRKVIAKDTADAYWSQCDFRFSGSEADCHWLANHGCAIGPWTSAHYKGQRKLPPKGYAADGRKKGGATIKKEANDAHRQGIHYSHKGPPSKTPNATFKVGRTLEAVNVQVTRGEDRLATTKERAADPDAFLPAHKIVKGKRGEHRCQVFQTDVLDAGGKVGREHDHETGTESVMTVGHTPNTSIVEPIRDLRKRGASLEQMQAWAQGVRVMLGRGAGVSAEIRALVDEARAAARDCSWPERDSLLAAPSNLEAKVLAREAAEAAAARGELDDDGADADDEAEGPTPTPRGGPPLPDSDEDGEEEWQDPATDGHAAAADELKAMVATYLSEWGGDARADAVGADIGAMFDAREL